MASRMHSYFLIFVFFFIGVERGGGVIIFSHEAASLLCAVLPLKSTNNRKSIESNENRYFILQFLCKRRYKFIEHSTLRKAA